MSRITDVSKLLGDFMLQGWVLTDERCPTSACPAPLLRSPRGRSPVVTFCASCDGGPEGRAQADGPSGPSALVSGSNLADTQASIRPSTPSEDATGSQSFRSSTPPTEVSSTLSSPIFAPPVDTEESLRRRQQSDAASAEIGKRLLKGWAMLADECPNSRCFGVPLVRPPRPSMDGPIRKECVACGTVYLEDSDGRPWNPPVASSSSSRPPALPKLTTTPLALTSSVGKEKGIQNTLTPSQVLDMASPAMGATSRVDHILASARTPHGGYSDVAESLDRALHTLSNRMNILTKDPSLVNPSSLGEVADAIAKISCALREVQQL